MRLVQQDSMRILLEKPSAAYWGLVAILVLTIGIGVFAWITQLRQGLGVTGLSSEVMWGIYIVNFVFFVGISYAGTLLSAVLRLVGAEWRRPVTRIAEIVTVVSLLIAGAMIFADMGRPAVAPLNMLRFGRATSPLIWDMIVLTTYLAGALLFLFLPLIPDIARCRDLYQEKGGMRYRIYRLLALAWDGNSRQQARLERAMLIIAITIIPVAIMAHSVVAWIFGVTLRPFWNSTIFAPYFVVGAVFSGTAAIIIVMALYRTIYGLHDYFTNRHFRYLGYILLTLNLLYMYFTFSEYLTIGYSIKADYQTTLAAVLGGVHAPFFWFAIVLGMIAPAMLVALPWTRTIGGITIASVFVVVGMWFKRWIIVVPPLEYGVTPGGLGVYIPTWIEWAITGAGLAALVLAFLIFQRFFPIISIWEVEHDQVEDSQSDSKPSVVAQPTVAAHPLAHQ